MERPSLTVHYDARISLNAKLLFCTMQQQQQQQQQQLPSVTITSQPERFCRFRYESEIDFTNGRVGGCLHSRSGKSVTVQIENIDRSITKRLKLMAFTVSQDHNPHPYYLHGDGCYKDCFVKEFDCVSSDSVVARLERVTIVRVRQRRTALDDAMKRRQQNVPVLVMGKSASPAAAAKQAPKPLEPIKLAFLLQVTFNDGSEQFCCPVFSDLIDNEKNKLTIMELSQSEFAIRSQDEQQVYMYFKESLKGTHSQDLEVKLNIPVTESCDLRCEADVINNHIIMAQLPNIQPQLQHDSNECDEQIKGNLIITTGNGNEIKCDIIFKKIVKPPAAICGTKKERQNKFSSPGPQPSALLSSSVTAGTKRKADENVDSSSKSDLQFN